MSYFLKSNQFDYSKPTRDTDINRIQETDPQGIKKFCNMSDEFLAQTSKVPAGTHIQDVMAENRLWNIAGYGFGEQEAYFLQQSMKKLAVKEDLKS